MCLRKLTDKIKYKQNTTNPEQTHVYDLYAVLRESGKLEKFGECHSQTLDMIKKHGLKNCSNLGLITWTYNHK